MPKKVTWKKGMRLSTDVFNAMESAHAYGLRLASLLASAGRFGLYPAPTPFDLSVNISNKLLEVTSLNCHGITKGGSLIDIDFNSDYDNTFETRVSIPVADEAGTFLLIVRMHENEWREVNGTYSEAAYTFDLIPENTKIDNHSLPIARIFNQFGWRLDETDFVPPCLYVHAHYQHEEQAKKCCDLARTIAQKCSSAQNCVARTLLLSIWGAASNAACRLETERETLTPAQLYGIVQQLVTAFLIGCTLDEYVTLENKEPFAMYAQKTLDTKSLYRDIESGLLLCAEIKMKMEVVCTMTEVKPVPVEQPKPKAAPAPEPKGNARNRWAGIEI